ncbi:MAG: DUF4340 domain-containing protein [Prolixibacteraceae bacterium]
MPNKRSNTRLLIVFAILLVLVLVLFTRKDSQKDRSFNKQLVELQHDEITQLKLFSKQNNHQELSLQKEGEQWMISDGQEKYRASNSLVEQMITAMEDLQAKSLVSNSKDKWDEYEVSDSLAAAKVEVYKDAKKLADVYIGKFKFSQPRNMSTYVRLSGKKEVYKVEGFLSSTFNRVMNDFRDKTVLKDPTANWTKLSFDYPSDSSFVLSKTNGKWMLDGVLADSVGCAGYVNSLKNQSGTSISSITPGGSVLYQLTVERENLAPVVLQVKQNGNENLLSSSENQEVWFNDKSLIEKIFVSKSKFKIH